MCTNICYDLADTLPIVGQDFGEQTRQDVEVADGEDVNVDHMAQTMNNCSENRNRSELRQRFPSLLSAFIPSGLQTWKDDCSHGHEAMEINGSVKWNVSIEESLSAQRDEVATDGEEHVGKQKGDGGRRTTRNDDAHHWSLRDACRFCLQTVIWKQGSHQKHALAD